MANLFKLVGTIFVDADAANESLQKTDKNATNVGKTIAAGVGTAAKWGAAITAGAAAAATSMIGLASSAAETADAIDKGSDAMGISTTAYQEWDYVMGQCGMDISSMSTGMKTLSNLMVDAANGNATAAGTFEQLGVSIYDANGEMKSQEQMMNDAIYALASMEEGAERSALANDLFGKSGVNMANMLNQGVEGIQALTDRAHELGVVMEEDAVSSGVQFGDLMADLKNSLGAMAAKLGSAVMPILNKIVDLIIKNLPTIQKLFDQLAPVLVSMLESLLPPLMEVVEAILPVAIDLLTSLIPFISEIASSILPLLSAIIGEILPPVMEIVSTILPTLLPLIQAILPILEPILALLNPLLEVVVAILQPICDIIDLAITPLTSVISTLISTALEPLDDAIDIIADAFNVVFGGAIEAVSPLIEGVQETFEGLISFITDVFQGDWEEAWEGIKDVFAGIFNGIASVVETVVNFIVDALNLISIKVPDWVPGIGGESFGFNLKHVDIPEFEEGGMPENGLFRANDRELVGGFSVGGTVRTAVANNAMIVEGIEGGVERAMLPVLLILNAISEKLGDMGLYLDGEKVAELLAPGINQQLGWIKETGI